MIKVMRNKAWRTVMVGAVLLVAASGCTDLIVEPKSTVTGANVFNDPASYRAFLAKLYAGLAVTGQQGAAGRGDIQGIDEGFSHYIRLLWQMEELPTDEAVISWNDAGVQELNTQLWGSSNQFLGAMYSRIFFQVSMVNEFLRETSDAKLDARDVNNALRNEIQQYRAEARFLRALSYWHGIDLFGDIPLVTEDFVIGATPPEQATRAQVYQYVVDELNAIRSELPAPGTGQYGRADQGAVAMLLAKLYLNAEVYAGSAQYANALTEAQNVISSGAYSLDDNYREIFLADNDKSPEIIFPVPQDGNNTQTWGGTTFLAHAAVGGNMNAGAFGLDFGWWGLRLTEQFVDLFPGGAASSDRRASSIFWTEGQNPTVDNLTNFFDGVAAPKYRNVTSSGNPGSHPSFPDIDYPMFRLADAYLMYAEAVLRGGGGSRAQAVQYINDLRERAYGDTRANISDADLTLDFILNERARELYWEGHRRTDLIRFDKFQSGTWAWKGGVREGRATEAFRALYPLPATELLANPNLKQNPGY
ncbi:MAG: RagB/SusD family nutrient uptake outer membrane protein [Gemmatimonadota bacterium]